MWKLIKILTFLIALISWSRAQVLGIDFGTEFWKAALISPGKNLVIVENSRSERKTLNSVVIASYRSLSTKGKDSLKMTPNQNA